VVVCSVKLLTTFYFEVVVAVTSLFFFLSNGSGNVVSLKVTVAHHCKTVYRVAERGCP